MPRPADRAGSETRERIIAVAFTLFSERGFEGASMRDIADAASLTPSSLYHHFAGKEAIVASMLAALTGEVDALAEWIRAQPRTPSLLREAALRWVDRTTVDRLQGMRLAQANVPLMRRLRAAGGGAQAFDGVVDAVLGPGGVDADRRYVRVVFGAVTSALAADVDETASLQDILATARRVVVALT